MRRAVLALALLLGTACAGPEGPVFFAAASLKEVMETAIREWDGEAELHLAASSTLRVQVDRGAGADLLIGADLESVRGLGHEPVPLWGNELVVITRTEAATLERVERPEDLAGLYCVAMAEPDLAPAGRYGRDALEALGLWDRVRDRVTGAADVRAALHQVHRGLCPAGIVYRTDADPRLVRVAFPLPSPRPVVYYAVPLGGSGEGADFLEFLRGPQGGAIARRAGLRPVEAAP